MDSRFDIQIEDKNRQFVCYLNDPIQLEATNIANGIGTLELFLRGQHKKLDRVAVEGNRVLIKYRGELLMSGMLRRYRLSGLSKQSVAQFGFDSDFRKLHTWLGWPTPGATVTAGSLGTQAVNDSITDNVETVIKYFVQRNLVTRLGAPVVIGPDLGRGPVVTVKSRFMQASELLIPLAELHGLFFELKRDLAGTGYVFDVREANQRPFKISELGGNLLNLETGWDAPTATRTIIGDSADDATRAFRRVSDTALETLWGDVVETFTNVTDSEATTAVMDAEGQATLLEGRSRAGVSLTLAESKHFRYGGTDGFHEGGIVSYSVKPSQTVPYEDVLRSVKLVWNAQDGVRATPELGEYQNSPDKKLYQVIKNMQSALRLLMKR